MRSGRRITAAAVSFVVMATTFVMTLGASPASAATACRIDYSASNWGGGGFSANVTVNNLGDALSNWTLTFAFPSTSQRVSQGWNANWTQSSANVTATSMSYNGSLATGASVQIGFNGTYTGSSNPAPTSFSLNGVACTGQPPGEDPEDPGENPETPADRVNNPYAGAGVYVNPDWAAKARAESGGSRIANQPTGVWMDRIAAIAGTTGARGLASHLDGAVQQDAANGSTPMVFQVVIYNLPGRDCAALASNGELGPGDLSRYKSEYIDAIAAILARPAYANLRIVTVIEIDSLPNLITNVAPRETATAQCDTMKSNGNYVNGVGYALNKLGDVPNVYNYIDAGHHGWIGWDDNLQPTIDITCQAARAQGATPADVWGFITNTANYSALREPFFTANTTVGGRVLREVSGGWVDWNRYVDELSFAQDFRTKAASCFGSNIGMLIDTSRNGWGGSARPTAASTSTDPITFMNQSRIDRRIHLGNWCNQSGAGLGERPRSAPATGIDAYVWIKPPGESDGSSSQIPNDEGKGFDRMCDPTYTGNPRNQNNMSGALPNAPLSGHWFSAQFQQLMQNAYPAL
ncbi:glycoside hydrolase family 6 protein [Actinophytocola oryzae]|uniref:glycoside hydrolase family 6 protein n=1 Tax=Actinophytocola oryzae TaxID=502181 RepID=UPI002443CA64|nr:glycoside hydrolase family 6 protein [Actinophytocola oryzae]